MCAMRIHDMTYEMEDRENDWLARQIREERKSRRATSDMFDLKAEHESEHDHLHDSGYSKKRKKGGDTIGRGGSYETSVYGSSSGYGGDSGYISGSGYGSSGYDTGSGRISQWSSRSAARREADNIWQSERERKKKLIKKILLILFVFYAFLVTAAVLEL